MQTIPVVAINEAEYGTNRTATGYDRVEMDEKYCKNLSQDEDTKCYRVVHQSINCTLLKDITNLLRNSNSIMPKT